VTGTIAAEVPPAALEAGHGVQGAHDHHATNTGLSHAKLGIWVFLSSEAMFFGSFIATYLFFRGRDVAVAQATHQVIPHPKDLIDIPFTSCTSFILLMSSLTMVLALAAIQRGDMRRLRIWLAATAAFGLTFISGQVYEFTNFYREGLHLSTGTFGSTFYVMTGLHGAHVTVGIFWLLALLQRSMRGELGPEKAEAVEIAGLYWHFVDIVWIVIFTVVYLVPYK
jgi:cytochrome c oxidase subunit 3/cytochrome o ubiquinol oxidase subunit 3